jgi:protein-L-isoaspartate(D-aspartate) O-methyltransferase
MDEDLYSSEREKMVRQQIIRRGLVAERVVEAMRRVPRHLFVPTEQRHMAYADCALPIGSGQTISQPYIVAIMTALLELEGHETVLEVGTGSGYQAAVLSYLAQHVYTIERRPELARRAAALLQNLKLENVEVHTGDGTLGLPEFAPFNAIIVTAASPQEPQALLDQLADAGRLVIPIGSRYTQYLERRTRSGSHYDSEELIPVAFVPLIGEQGWQET